MGRPARGAALAVALATLVAALGWLVVSTTTGEAKPAAAPTAAVSAARTTVASTTSPASAPLRQADYSIVLAAKPALLRVNASPGGREVMRLTNPNRYGRPLVLLAIDGVPGWWHVELPVRPNGSRGWVRDADVTVSRTPYSVHVYRHAHQLDVHRTDAYGVERLAMRVPIAVGTSDTPTPGGHYYLSMLFKVADPSGPYGPWAFGISGFSPVYTTFGSGLGEIGIHGTNEPWLIGRDVSHGCIRLRNADITRLAHLVPVGAPVVIHQ